MGSGSLAPALHADLAGANQRVQDVAAVLFDQVNLVGTETSSCPQVERMRTFSSSSVRQWPLDARLPRTKIAPAVPTSYPRLRILATSIRWGSTVIGAHVRLDDGAHVVIGILGPRFDSTIFHSQSPDVWTPLHIDRNSTDAFLCLAAARLKPGVTIAMANARAGSPLTSFIAGSRPHRPARHIFSGAVPARHGPRRPHPPHAGRRRVRADRVCQRRQPDAGPRVRAAARDRHSRRHRRQPESHRSSIAHRKPAPLARRRRTRSRARCAGGGDSWR